MCPSNNTTWEQWKEHSEKVMREIEDVGRASARVRLAQCKWAHEGQSLLESLSENKESWNKRNVPGVDLVGWDEAQRLARWAELEEIREWTEQAEQAERANLEDSEP